MKQLKPKANLIHNIPNISHDTVPIGKNKMIIKK